MVPLGGIAWSFDYAVAGKWLLHGLGVKQLSHRQENCHAAPTQANSRLDSENKSTTMPIARLLGENAVSLKRKRKDRAAAFSSLVDTQSRIASSSRRSE